MLPAADAATGAGIADDGLLHLACCNPDKALCGADLTGVEITDQPPGPDDCVVCRDLEFGPPCGAPFCALRLRWRWSRWGQFGRGATPP